MAQLDEAYILSSYTVDGRGDSSNGWARLGVTPLLDVPESRVAVTQKQKQASSSSGSSRRGGTARAKRTIAVNTVQRNGVHLVDLVDQSPLASFTVSPSVTFTGSAVSVSYPSTRPTTLAVGEASTSRAESTISYRTRKTFASVHDEQEGSTELWCWTEQESEDGSSAGQPVRSSFSLQVKAVALSLLAVSEHLLVTLSDGQILLLSLELQEVARTSLRTGSLVRQQALSAIPAHGLASLGFTAPTSESTIVFPLLSFSATTASLASTTKANPKKSKRKSLGVETGIETSGAPRLAKVNITYVAFNPASRGMAVAAVCQLADVEDVVDAACLEADGTSVVVLSASGKLATHTIAAQSGFRQHSIDIHLSSTSTSSPTPAILSSTIAKSLDLSPDTLAISSSSLTALSLASGGARSAASLYFLLTTRESASLDTLRFLLFDARFGLVLAEHSLSLPSANPASASRAACPHVVGLDKGNVAFSNQAHVDGQPQRESFYVVPCSTPERSTLADMMGTQTLTQRYLVAPSTRQESAQMLQHSAIGSREGDAAATQSRHELLAKVQALLGSADVSKRDTKQADEAVKAWVAGLTPASNVPTAFTQQLLELALATTSPSAAVSTGVIAALISRSLISDTTSRAAPVGLVSSLLGRDKVEWPLIMSALRKFRDISEDSLVAALRVSASDENAELLPRVLRAVMRCPVTQAELRKSLKAGLGVQELEEIMEICEDWLAGSHKAPAEEDQGGEDAEGAEEASSDPSPGVDYVVPFLQTVFDAHLVSLLQTPSLHPLIQSLSQHLASELQLSASVLSLQGPLAEIHKIHLAQVAEEKERKKRQVAAQAARKKQREILEKDPQAKKIAARRQKDRLLDDADERWKAKQRAQEAGLSVGRYALEEFNL